MMINNRVLTDNNVQLEARVETSAGIYLQQSTLAHSSVVRPQSRGTTISFPQYHQTGLGSRGVIL